MNNDGAGATQKKPGTWDCALTRSVGYSKTMSAMDNKTRSRHKGTGENNLWKSAGSGLGGNVKGYGSHGGGSHSY
jgi:hypothetical protein